MTYVALGNLSSLVSDAEARLMARACAHQARYDLSPAWGQMPGSVVFHPKGSTFAPPPGSINIVLKDDDDQTPGALGWHSEDDGEVLFGEILCKPVLDNGGDALTRPLSVASVLSHEVCEALIDPRVQMWADDVTASGKEWALEVCDPVESDSYSVPVSNGKKPDVEVTVSNFVLPRWFDGSASGGTFDFMGKVRKPFTMSPGGYVVTRSAGKESQTFGEKFPEWRRGIKRRPRARMPLG